jgi:hypothetical protein
MSLEVDRKIYYANDSLDDQKGNCFFFVPRDIKVDEQNKKINQAPLIYAQKNS